MIRTVATLILVACSLLPGTVEARQAIRVVPVEDVTLQCLAAHSGNRLLSAAAGGREGSAGTGFDAGYYRIEFDLSADTLGYLEGTTRIVGRVTAPVLPVLELDFHPDMAVSSVQSAGGESLSFSRDGAVLLITLEQAAMAGETVDVTVDYAGAPSSTGFGSFAAGELKSGYPYAWTLSEPYGARTWWPGVDHPADKADSVDVVVRAPDPMQVVSNGLFQGSTPHDDGSTTWHWKHRYPISSYLVSISGGVFDYDEQTYVRPDSLAAVFGPSSFPIVHYGYEGLNRFEGNGGTYGWHHALGIMPVFEWWYGPYPFEDEHYGHASFTWGGGMEHQTISSMGGNYFGLVAHELAHQWFGDAVGPRTWPHLWLNEGFATMGEIVAWEALYPGPTAQQIFDIHYSGALNATGTLVLQDTSSVSTMFNGARVYKKGAMVLHMIRSVVGDLTFRDILRAYAADPSLQYGTATTDEFRRVVEEVSGRDWSGFFRQWVTEGTGHPVYEATWTASEETHGWRTRVTLFQRQLLPLSNMDIFEMPVEIRVVTASGPETFVVQNAERDETFTLNVTARPTDVLIDPGRKILRSPVVPVTYVGSEPSEQPSQIRITSVHPNPADRFVAVGLEGSGPGRARLEVFDVTGRLVRALDVAMGTREAEIPVNDLAAGLYVVRLRTDSMRESRPVVIAR